MKRITLCADDFGMHPSVSEAIVTLAEQQRIHATSALVTSRYCQQDAKGLQPLANTIHRGLHLNFTEGNGLTRAFQNGLPGLLPMLWRSHCRLLSPQHLEDEIKAQLERFGEFFGTYPDFIDGHQHVHHLPQVRQALFRVLLNNAPPRLWIRSVSPLSTNSSPVKSRIIIGSGAHPLRQRLHQSNYYTNAGFAGIYSLSERADFKQLMTFWINTLPDRGLIMCHPGKASTNNTTTEHQMARHNEFNYLSSEQFLNALHKAGVHTEKLSPPCLRSQPLR